MSQDDMPSKRVFPRSIKICLSANTSWYLFNFRKHLIQKLLGLGSEVSAICPEDEYTDRLRDLGCSVYSIELAGRKIDPLHEIRSVLHYRRLYSQIQPDLIMNFTLRPVIFGSLSVKKSKIKVIDTITGLGTAFLSMRLARRAVLTLLRWALRQADVVIFQNSADKELFAHHNLVSRKQTKIVPGSGVDTKSFPVAPIKLSGPRVFLFSGRLLKDKGIEEFMEVAQRFRYQEDVIFQVVGQTDSRNPSSLKEGEIESRFAASGIDYLGHSDQMSETLSRATCIVLPSYREGMSRSLLEAASAGRPLIATNVPGCREIVKEGWNGFQVLPKSADSLEDAIHKFMKLSDEEIVQFGENSRTHVEQNFSEALVNRLYIEIIEEVLAEKCPQTENRLIDNRPH